MIKNVFDLIHYENNDIVNELDLVKAELFKKEEKLVFRFKGKKPLNVKLLADLLEAIETKLVSEIKVQDCSFVYDTFTDEDLSDYYNFVVRRIGKKTTGIVCGLTYETKFENKLITVNLPKNDNHFTFYTEEILSALTKFGIIGAEIKCIEKDDSIDIKEKILSETTETIKSAMKNMSKEEEYEVLLPDRLFKGFKMDLGDFPKNLEDFERLRTDSRQNSYILEGIVQYTDTETLDKKNKAKFIISDGKYYIYCETRRLNSKEENRFYRKIDVGMHCVILGYPEYQRFTEEVVFHIVNVKHSVKKKPITTRKDEAKEKRVELHLHTKMSSLDGAADMGEYLSAAKIFGHTAIAVTDHASVQSFHDLHEFTKKNPDFKAIYGVELNFVDEDKIEAAYNSRDIVLDDQIFVAYDIETTGFSEVYERIIEISAVKYQHGVEIDTFSELVNPEKNIPPAVMSLTGITNKDVETARKRDEVLKDFRKFIEGSVLVAHNASFDYPFVMHNFDELGIEHPEFPVIDTLVLMKALVPGRRGYGLDPAAKYYKVKLDQHHRALDDARCCGEIFYNLLKEEGMKDIKLHSEINSLVKRGESFKYPIPKHINLIAQTQKGLINLYHLLSIASTDYCTHEANLTKDVLETYREGILVGTGCRNSYFYDIVARKTDKDIEEIIDMYDYIEVQPQNTFEYMKYHYDDHVFVYQNNVKRIINLAKKHNKIVVATGDCHQVNKEDILFRDILVNTKPVGGERRHYLFNEKELPAEYYMTTEEMLEQFSFLGEELAYEIVVTNTNKIKDMCDNVKSFTNTPYPPKDDFMNARGIPSAEEYVKESVYKRAYEMYGEPLPGIVFDRVKNELDNIIKNKFSTIYLISQMMVYKSRDDGFVVGSRGSVGSSFVAHLMDITEVNSLPPHYRCPKCHFSAFKMLPEEKVKYGIKKEEEEFIPILDDILTGFDLPDKYCPICGSLLIRDGQDIPFETFLGVPEDPKTPDIDLNFSGLNQPSIHNYIRELFGQTKAFRAGTILTCKDKTSYAVVRDYFDVIDERRAKAGLEPEVHSKAEIESLGYKITGSKRSSSQHPGGIVVVPIDHEVYEVTPVQYPGDSKDRSWMTTHFDYHTFEKNLFKLDVLGHDDPTVIRYLMQYVKKYPDLFPFDDALKIPVNDHKLFLLMNNTEVIDCKPEEIESNVATYGISEFGTPFVRGMLEKAKPSTFSELLKISGLSHGTDVWNDNAEALIAGTAKSATQSFPKIEFQKIIGCRDDIMTDLISFGVPAPFAFKIMEFVRKGKPTKEDEKWQEILEKLKDYPNVPEWYKWSCGKIKYMFPKAHATAYVVMALRIAWFKLYQPIFFYSALMSNKMTSYDIPTMVAGAGEIKRKLDELKGRNDLKPKEEDLITTLELGLEMTVRGMKFLPVDLEHSLASDFRVSDDLRGLYIPYAAIDGLGGAAANSIVDARNEKMFKTKADFRERCKVSSTLIKKMEEFGVFDGIPEDNQLTLDLGI